MQICNGGDVPSEIETRARSVVQTRGHEWDEISVFCLIESAAGKPPTWLFGFSGEPLAPGDPVKSERVAARLTVTRYVRGQAPAPGGPPISLYDRVVHAPPAARSRGLRRGVFRRR